MMFPDMNTACRAASVLRTETAVDAVEVFDRAALRECEADEGLTKLVVDIKGADPGAASLLIECRGEDAETLQVCFLLMALVTRRIRHFVHKAAAVSKLQGCVEHLHEGCKHTVSSPDLKPNTWQHHAPRDGFQSLHRVCGPVRMLLIVVLSMSHIQASWSDSVLWLSSRMLQTCPLWWWT